ncbi:MAG: AEC family transporter [Ruminiclostridium sp.]|nr:AEC family transporter [Ruminiclostridium sp.]
MDSFLFSIRATAPVFLLMVLGYLFRRIGLLDAHFCQVSDKFVFTVALPVMLFRDMATTRLRETFDLPYVLFCALVTTLVFFSLWGLARKFLRDPALVGEFVQVSYRSSAAILGCAIIMGIYGNTGMAPLMIIGSVPLFNIYAVLVLTLEGPKANGDLGHRLRHALKSIATNPIILGILLGVFPSLFGLDAFPPILDSGLDLLARVATPLALLSLGAAFQGKAALGKLRLSALAASIKLLILPALFLPLAAVLGFTGSKLVALIVMLGSTSTPTCYIMARNLGHEGTLTASVVVLTTVCSAFTLTFWIFLCRQFGLIA